MLCSCSHCTMRFLHSVALHPPLCGRWVCVAHASERACYPVNIGSTVRRVSNRAASHYFPTRRETFGSNRTMEPTQRRQKTKSGGFSTLANTVELSWVSKSVREYVLEVEVTLVGSIPQMKPLYCDYLFGDCVETLRRGCLSSIQLLVTGNSRR